MFSLAHLSLILLTLFARGQSFGRCEVYKNLTRACIAGWAVERASFMLPSASPYSDSDPGWLANAIRQTTNMREAEGAFRVCLSDWDKLSLNCEVDQATKQEWWDAIAERGLAQIDLVNKLNFVMSSLNAKANWNRYALTCYKHLNASYGYRLCYVLDRRTSTYGFIRSEHYDNLPLSVGSTKDCTFLMDSAGRAFTADHCGVRHFDSAWPFGHIGYEVRADYRGSLPYSATSYQNGEAFEDFALFALRDKPAVPVKPFYHLAYDDYMAKGCELRQAGVVVCSKAALLALSGKMANTLAFPGSHYFGVSGDNRRANPNSVFWAQGHLYFEPDFERFFFQAYATTGSSGAPVYLPAGMEVGGVLLDRPLVLGLVSGSVGANGGSTDISGEVMSIVAVNRASRLIPLLTGPRAVYAIGTSP